MRRSNKSKIIDSTISALDVYVAPLLLVGLGIVMVVLTFTSRIPKPPDLAEVKGHLNSYYHKQTGRGRDDYTTIVILEEGVRFWTNAINKDSAAKIFGERGVGVRFYAEPDSTNVPIDGAVKSYGLWVNGQQIESLDSSLGHEKFIVRFGFPAIGIFSITVAILIYRRNKAKYAEYNRTPPNKRLQPTAR